MRRILFVEDNESNIYLMKFILEKNGFEVIVAKDGIRGVEMAKQEKPELIVMDIQLPKIDGYEATKRIKKIPELKDIPIIAVTSYAMTGDREKTLKAGCTDYIEKPINPESFINIVKKYI